jgi:hypothetical protein
MRMTLFLAVSSMLGSVIARGDGGIVRLHEASGPFSVTVFTAGDPLQAGPIDVSVLVQDRQTGAPMLDATVKLAIQPVFGTGPAVFTLATSEQANNKLLKAARITVPGGSYAVSVSLSKGHQEAVFVANLRIVAANPRVSTIWPLLIIPPFAIALFALHQMLLHPAIRQTKSGPPYANL